MKKKTFITGLTSALNVAPATAFISQPETAKRSAAPNKPNGSEESAVTQSNTETEAEPVKEVKSRRLQSLLKPSLYEYLKRSAQLSGLSVNDRLNQLLEEAQAGEER